LLNKGKKEKTYSLTKPSNCNNKNTFSDCSSLKKNNIKPHTEQLLKENGNQKNVSSAKNLLV
jgi:hypothetical protein